MPHSLLDLASSAAVLGANGVHLMRLPVPAWSPIRRKIVRAGTGTIFRAIPVAVAPGSGGAGAAPQADRTRARTLRQCRGEAATRQDHTQVKRHCARTT